MHRLTIILIGLLAPTVAIAEDTQQRPFTYAISVSFAEDNCIYQTGDVLMSANQFKHDLKARFDPKNSILIYYTSGLPNKCLTTAKKIAASIGFQDIKAEAAPVGRSFGPPG